MSKTDCGSSLYSFIAVLILSVACVPKQELISNNPFILLENSKPWVIAHGGAKDLFPENTMVAFEGAITYNVDALEMDIKLTADNILITHHDDEIDRMSDGEGKVNDYTFEELKKFNFGYDFEDLNGNRPYQNIKVEVTSLESLMVKYTEIPMIIEIKDQEDLGKNAADLLMSMIEKYGRKENTIIASFHDEIIDYILSKENDFLVSTAEGEARKMVISTKTGFGIFYKPNAMAVQLPMESSGLNLAKKRVVKSAHRHNMAVHYWTIDDKDDMKLLINNGADGLITDRPDLMNEVLKELGYE